MNLGERNAPRCSGETLPHPGHLFSRSYDLAFLPDPAGNGRLYPAAHFNHHCNRYPHSPAQPDTLSADNAFPFTRRNCLAHAGLNIDPQWIPRFHSNGYSHDPAFSDSFSNVHALDHPNLNAILSIQPDGHDVPHSDLYQIENTHKTYIHKNANRTHRHRLPHAYTRTDLHADVHPYSRTHPNRLPYLQWQPGYPFRSGDCFAADQRNEPIESGKRISCP